MIENNQVILRLTPQEVLLVSQAFILAAGASEDIELPPGLSRWVKYHEWYAKLAEVIQLQAIQITEGERSNHDRNQHALKGGA